MKTKKQKRLRRITALILCMSMLVTSFPAMAFAETADAEVAEEPSVTEDASPEAQAVPVSEIDDLRSETVKHFLNEDGSFTAVNYMTPVHYQRDGESEWTEIDNSLSEVQAESADGETEYIPQDSPIDVQITDASDSEELVRLASGEHQLSWSYENLKKTKAEKKPKKEKKEKKDKAKKDEESEMAEACFPGELSETLTDGLVYENIAESTDLEIILSGKNLKENLILKDKHAQTDYVIRYDIGSLTAVQKDKHTIILKEDSKEVFNIQAPYMNDAAGAYSDGVEVDILSQEEGILRVSLTADKQWVKAKERVYPIVVDPYVLELSQKTNYDAAAFQYIQGSSYPYGTLAAGNDGDYATGDGKSYIKFTLPDLKAGDMVTGGELYLYQFAGSYGYDSSNADGSLQVNAYRVKESWTASDIINQSYSSAPKAYDEVADYFNASRVGSETRRRLDLSRIIKVWYGGEPNYGICLKADSSDPDAMARFIATDNAVYTGYYPFLTVRYLNNQGLEDRWTYHEQSPGEKGTGYVNDYTGNLVYTVPIVETTGERMPVTLSLVYNGYQSGRVDQITTAGAGWRLNIQQRVIKLEEENTGYGSSINALYDSLYETGYRYVYEDADGTAHYFRAKENSTTKFVDEEGMGLELSAVSSSDDSLEVTKIVAEDGSKLTFTSRGYLRNVYDSDGNYYRVMYSTQTPGMISSVKDGAGRSIRLTLDGANNNRVTEVTGPDNRPVEIVYNDAGRIYTVNYYDGNNVGFAYSDGKIIRVKGTDNSRIKYTYCTAADSNPGKAAIRNRVASVTGYSRNSTSACLDEHKGQWMEIVYGRNRTTFTDKDGFRQVYQFDNYGRTVSINDADGAYTSYGYINPSTNPTEGSEKAHLMKNTATTAEYTENLLVNHSFENGLSDWLWTDSAPDESGHYLGTAAAYLDDAGDIVSQRYDASSGKYTFSAYVKSSSSAVLPKLRVSFYDASDNRISYIDTKPRENQLTWARMHLAFEVPPGTSYFRVVMRMEGDGEAWFDCAQLETGSVLNKYNLVENSDFDKALSGTWTEVNTVSADARKTDDGNYYYLTGEGSKEKRLYQRIPVNKSAKNLHFSVSGLGKAYSVPFTSDNKRFALTLYTKFTSGTKAEVIKFNPDYTASQYTAGVCGYSGDDADKTVEYIEIRCVYNGNENAAKFDRLQVNLDESGTAYTYDDEGNLISSSDNAGRNQTFTYSDAGEILTAKSADNKNYEYTYAADNKHRLKSATSKSSDVKFSFNYDDYGGMTSQRVQAVDSSNEGTGMYISQNQVYTANGNYVKEEYNDRGYGHEYTWNEEKGIITKALDENDNETKYGYDEYDDYLTRVEKDESIVNYTYNSNNYLTKIATGTTSYSFSYDQFGNVETTKAGSHELAENTYNDNNGNLKNTVYGNGFKLGYTYDIKDRVTAAFHNGTAKFRWSYGADGQVGRHEDLINNKTYQYTYDLAGRLLRTDISDGNVIRMDYNDISLPTGIHYSSSNDGGHNVYYSYADRDNLPKTTTFGSGRVVTNTYDGLTRLDNVKYETTQSSAPNVVTDYTYRNYGSSTERTTSFVEHIDYTYASGDLNTNDRFYTYGPAGNILTESRGTESNKILQEQYVYDAKGQVEKHFSPRNGETWVYTYDNSGNIQNKKRYAGVTTPAQLSAASSPTEDIDYGYSTGTWGDLLTEYNGKAVTSDAIGNMTSYDGQSWAWKGRQLESYTDKNGVKTTYTYNADGIRTKKTTGNKTTEFFLNGDQILMMKTTEGSSEDIIWFFYDSQGQRVGLCRNGTYMYYLYNLQGDVMAIASAGTGQLVATYKYDTWGNCTVDELSGYAIGDLNPFRYRGYFWDEESGMYYLNSRYYSSEFGRFISADSQVNSDILGGNLFAYCSNNPVNRTDDQGDIWALALGIGFMAGIVGQYLSDIVQNYKDGRTGTDMFTPTSSVKEYAIAGASGAISAIPGLGIAKGLAVGITASVGADCLRGEIQNGKDFMHSLKLGLAENLAGEVVAKGAVFLKVMEIDSLGRNMRKNYVNSNIYGAPQNQINSNYKKYSQSKIGGKMKIVEDNVKVYRASVHSSVTSAVISVL